MQCTRKAWCNIFKGESSRILNNTFIYMFQMSSLIIYAKEVASFGEVSYSFLVQCDANKQYFSCTLKKRNGETFIGSIDFPFEVMELLQISICNVSEYVSHVENFQLSSAYFPSGTVALDISEKLTNERLTNVFHCWTGGR